MMFCASTFILQNKCQDDISDHIHIIFIKSGNYPCTAACGLYQTENCGNPNNTQEVESEDVDDNAHN
jgi:hypothetical protein